jgi:hypothetical protein
MKAAASKVMAPEAASFIDVAFVISHRYHLSGGVLKDTELPFTFVCAASPPFVLLAQLMPSI